MKEPLKTQYYQVAVALDATWKSNEFTYQSTQPMQIGEIVEVPFGKGSKLGIISTMASKPTYATKDIYQTTGNLLPKRTLALLRWIASYYPGSPGLYVQQLLPSFIKSNTFEAVKDKANPLLPLQPAHTMPPLTPAQKKAVTAIEKTNKPSVLYGITGSGKTRVYAELIKEQLSMGKNVLLLYPEISLTAQIHGALTQYFGEHMIHSYHSKLTKTEQKNTWLSSYNNQSAAIYIGTRSSLFLPHQNVGTIIVDESHDNSYKQDSGNRYNGVVVAGALAQLHDAKLVVGSATPSIQETHQILEKKGNLVVLDTLAKSHNFGQKDFMIVDMTKSHERIIGTQLLSKKLFDALQDSLENKKQSLLFLNRRGTARMVVCSACGWHAECPSCDNPLMYHHDTHRLQCHICGFAQPAVITCPKCSSELQQKSPGTKALQEELQQLFPRASIGRFDSDNKKSESFTTHYTDIKHGKKDIIIGTQLITKGLDLPLLQTVGIISADSHLYLPDYSSEERAFQLLMQVSGRVGRGHTHGRVILQTYQAHNPVFELVRTQDWPTFYAEELARRRLLKFPPYSFLAKIWVSKKTQAAAEKSIKKIATGINKTHYDRMLGPAPCFYERTHTMFSWQLLLLSANRRKLLQAVQELPKDALYDIDPTSLL